MDEEVKEKKISKIIYFIIVPVLLIALGGTIGFVIINNSKVEHYSSNDSAEETESKEKFKNVDIDDEIVKKAYEMIDIEYFENVTTNIVEVFYSGREIKVSDLTDEQKMFLNLNYYTKMHDYYMCSDSFEVSSDDLSKEFFENDSYIGLFKRNSTVNVGYFSLDYDKTFAVKTTGCFGIEGPTSTFATHLESASKNDETLLINVRYAYLYQDFEETFDEDENTFYYVGYDNYLREGTPVQDKLASDEEIEWNKYKLFQFEFKIDNDKLYFQGVKLA